MFSDVLGPRLREHDGFFSASLIFSRRWTRIHVESPLLALGVARLIPHASRFIKPEQPLRILDEDLAPRSCVRRPTA